MKIDIPVDISRQDWRTLRRYWRLLQREFEDDNQLFSFFRYISDVLENESYRIRTGKNPEDDPKTKEEILDIIRNSEPQGALRQIRIVAEQNERT